MTLDYIGTRLDFTLIARHAARYRLSFTNITGAEPLSIRAVTFAGTIEAEDGTRHAIECAHTDTPGLLDVTFPALEKGRYEFELAALSLSGKSRMVYGMLGVHASVADLMADAEPTEVRTLMVRIPDAPKAQIQLEWRAVSAGHAAIEDVLDAASRAEAAANKTEQMAEFILNGQEKVEVLTAQLATLEGKLLSAVIPNTITNTWWICGVNTGVQVTGDPGKSPQVSTGGTWLLWNPDRGVWEDTGMPVKGEDGRSPYVSTGGTWVQWNALLGRWEDTGLQAMGRDGIDGAAVRRIRVPSVADIPSEGETCHGGVMYYVPNKDRHPRAFIVLAEDGRSGEDSLTIDGVSVDLDGLESGTAEEAALELSLAIREAAVPGVDVEGVDGAKVQLVSSNEVLTVAASGAAYHVTEIPSTEEDGFMVFAWLEELDGSAGWVFVGLNNDIATDELYGLTMLSTPVPVVGGAPVGNNRSGQLSVPRADLTTPGTVLPGLNEHIRLQDGGPVTTDEQGRMVAAPASATMRGAAMLSSSERATARCIGLTDDGKIGCTPATSESGGTVLLSTNEIILQGGGIIGKNELGQLVLRPAGYRVYGGVCFGTDSSITLNDAPYVITIAKCNGLTTFNEWAGNMINSMNFNLAQQGCLRYDTAGPNGENTGNSLYLLHDGSLEVTEEGKLSAASYIERTCIVKSDLDNYALQTEVDKCVKKTSSWESVVALTKDEHNALTKRHSKTLYIVLNKSVQS